jgi:hypothetical protein
LAAVYSTQLFAGVVTAGTATSLGSPPTGSVWVVRQIDYRCQSATAATVALAISGVATPFFAETTSFYSQPPWQGRLVVVPGQTLEIEANTENYEVVVSGYLLST